MFSLRRIAPVLAVAFTLLIGVAAYAAEAKGKIGSVNADKNEFVMADDAGKNWTIMTDKNVKVLVNDKASKLGDLQANDEVVVTYEKDGEKLIAKEIKATRK